MIHDSPASEVWYKLLLEQMFCGKLEQMEDILRKQENWILE